MLNAKGELIMLNKTKRVKLYHLPFYMVLSSLLVFFIFLTDSVNVSAQGLSYTLPYNVVDYQDANSACMAYLNDIFNAITTSEPNFDTTNCILVPTRVNSNVISITALDNHYQYKRRYFNYILPDTSHKYTMYHASCQYGCC